MITSVAVPQELHHLSASPRAKPKYKLGVWAAGLAVCSLIGSLEVHWLIHQQQLAYLNTRLLAASQTPNLIMSLNDITSLYGEAIPEFPLWFDKDYTELRGKIQVTVEERIHQAHVVLQAQTTQLQDQHNLTKKGSHLLQLLVINRNLRARGLLILTEVERQPALSTQISSKSLLSDFRQATLMSAQGLVTISLKWLQQQQPHRLMKVQQFNESVLHQEEQRVLEAETTGVQMLNLLDTLREKASLPEGWHQTRTQLQTEFLQLEKAHKALTQVVKAVNVWTASLSELKGRLNSMATGDFERALAQFQSQRPMFYEPFQDHLVRAVERYHIEQLRQQYQPPTTSAYPNAYSSAFSERSSDWRDWVDAAGTVVDVATLFVPATRVARGGFAAVKMAPRILPRALSATKSLVQSAGRMIKKMF